MTLDDGRRKLLVVGAFPGAETSIFGGILTTCNILLRSEFSIKFKLILIDSTQKSNPPPFFIARFIFSIIRIIVFLINLFIKSPDAVLLFSANGFSALEKGLLARIARLKGIPVLLFPRGDILINDDNNTLFRRLWVIFALRGATHLLCQGAAWQRFAINKIGFNIEHAPIINNWSATTELLQLGKSRLLDPSDVVKRVVFMGWLEKEKGLFELLEACNELLQEYNFVLTIAGRGSAENEARAYVNKNFLNDYIKFTGWVHGNDKFLLLNSADIFVLPSWTEGFPNVIIEAMAAKLAVIVSNVGNIPDVLTDRVEALLISPKKVEEIVSSLKELLSNSSFRSTLALNGHNFAERNFSTNLGISRLITIVDVAIDKSVLEKG